MGYWTKTIKNFFIVPDSGKLNCTTEIDSHNTVTVNFGNSFTMRLSVEDAAKLKDALVISVIKIQDRMNYSMDTSRITHGDMG